MRPCAQKMFLAGAQGLESKKEWINELNVFPVPDGDTGNQYDAHHHVGGERSSGPWRILTMAALAEGGVVRFSARCARKFRRNPLSASARIHQGHQD